jgi:hypothetical protein
MDIVDMAIHPLLVKNLTFMDYQISQKNTFTNTSKKISCQIFLPFKDILVQGVNSWCITKIEMTKIILFGLSDSANTF